LAAKKNDATAGAPATPGPAASAGPAAAGIPLPRPELEALLGRHLPGLHAFLRLRAGPLIRARESMSDLAQSVCRELLEARDFDYRNEAAFRRWLCTAALRKLVERQRFYRRDKRDVLREVAPPTDAADALLTDAYRSIATPSQNAAAQEFVGLVESALDELPDHYREVIALTRGLGLSQREAAAQMGKTEIAVQRLLARALVKLSGILRARGVEPGE
jgi:RNA polymerase sigma factor (sigma-70 family)